MICPICRSVRKDLWDFVEHWRISHAVIGKWEDIDHEYRQRYKHGYNCSCGAFFDSTWGMKRHLEQLDGETVEDHFMAGTIMDALNALGG